MEYTLNTYDFLSILGSLAWLPPIFLLIRNFIIKPRISIITDNVLEIGFTTLGPIINTRLAFIADNKKALIDKIILELTHENKNIQEFTWDWFEELLYQTDLPNAAILPTRKNQKAIAINLKKEELIEKKIGFQQNTFKNAQKTIIQNIVEDSINLTKAQKPISDISSMKNYNDLLNHFHHSFNWKPGRYEIRLKVFATSMSIPIEKTISFKLTELQVNNLESNVTACHKSMEKVFVNPELELEEWRWIDVNIEI